MLTGLAGMFVFYGLITIGYALQVSTILIPEPMTRSMFLGLSPVQGLLILHGYLDPGKMRASGVKSHQ